MDIILQRHLFATLTYARNGSCDEYWKKCSMDFNRYIQRVRRGRKATGKKRRYFYPDIAYFRSVEQHRDGFPHIHILLQYHDNLVRSYFHHTTRSGRSSKKVYYIDSQYRDFLKSCWTAGHTDYQVPHAKAIGQLTYIMKYISKNSTTKTVWRKILAGTVDSPNIVKSQLQNNNAAVESSMEKERTLSKASPTVATNPISYQNIKLLSWSRNFDFSVFRKDPEISLPIFQTVLK